MAISKNDREYLTPLQKSRLKAWENHEKPLVWVKDLVAANREIERLKQKNTEYLETIDTLAREG